MIASGEVAEKMRPFRNKQGYHISVPRARSHSFNLIKFGRLVLLRERGEKNKNDDQCAHVNYNWRRMCCTNWSKRTFWRRSIDFALQLPRHIGVHAI